jgi:hypothetical protein
MAYEIDILEPEDDDQEIIDEQEDDTCRLCGRPLRSWGTEYCSQCCYGEI